MGWGRQLGAWHDRWLGWRDRLLASRAFQRRAAAFVLTRPTARRHAGELFDLVAGFVYSQVLLACVELDLFERLARGPQTADDLAAQLDLPLDATERLLAAAVAIRLLQRRSDGRHGLGPLGAPMVGNHAVAAMVRHHAALYADLADPLSLLRSDRARRQHTALARYWDYGGAGGTPAPEVHRDASAVAPVVVPGDGQVGARVEAYSTLMAASQPLVADEILDAYPLRRHRCLLDVGGGDGRFVASVAARWPTLRLQVFDLPAVAARARARFEREGLGGRAEAFGGDFLRDPLPAGADIVTLVRVVHDHDDAAAMTILRAARAALPPGGTLLLAEPMAGTAGAEAMGDAYFGLYLFAMGRGRPRRVDELTAMLHGAGFSTVRHLPTRLPLQTRLLVATASA